MMRGGPPRHVTQALPFDGTAAGAIARARAGARPEDLPAPLTESPSAPPRPEEPKSAEPPAARDASLENSKPPAAAAAPLEVFGQLAKEFFRETGGWPPGHPLLTPGGEGRERERADRWAAWLRDRRRTAPASNEVEKQATPSENEEEVVRHDAGGEQAAPSPQPAAGAPEPAAAAPRHAPKLCSSCNAPILWAQLLDEQGQRIKNPDTGRMKSIPVDFQPDPDGNVVLWHRDGEGIVARVLKKGEVPPAGARLRKSHFATCPQAHQHRRSGRRGGRHA